jgi:hypothetical protein
MTNFCKSSPVFEIETAETAFGEGERFRGAIDCGVGCLICGFELVEGGFGIPVVEGEVETRTGKVAQEASLPEVRISLKQPDPVSLGAIDGLKAFFATGLDFVLPEGYKHSCPILLLSLPGNPESLHRGRLACRAIVATRLDTRRKEILSVVV